MTSKRAAVVQSAMTALVATLCTAMPALAHHSYAMFDDKKVVNLEGTVKEWQFTNPHTWLILTVDDAGNGADWAIEGSTTNSLLRRGWSRSTFKPGDKIKIEVNPLRDGRKGGAFLKATLPDGTVLTQFRTN